MLSVSVLSVSVLSVSAVILWGPSAHAAPVRLGFSGVHSLPSDLWDGMNDSGRADFLTQRADLAASLGATVVRLGASYPGLADYDSIHSGEHRDWRRIDLAIGLFLVRGIELCVTLPDLFDADELAPWKDFLSSLAERYDGDSDFGVDQVDLNYEHPDIDGSGEITQSDWDASDAGKQAWAEAHEAVVLEIGHEPRSLETTSELDVDAYAEQLEAARQIIDQAGGEPRVMLAGTLMEGQSKQHFTERLDPLAVGGAPWFDLFNAHVFESTGELGQETAGTQVSKLLDWVAATGHPDAEAWLGELAVPSRPVAEAGGPCSDERCSERTQAAGVVKLVLQAVADGYTTLLYSEPIEIVGDFVDDTARSGTGLLTLEVVPGIEITQLPLSPRPAYAVWRRLGEVLDGVEVADVSALGGMPQNARGFQVADRGWVLWYDWHNEIGPGEEYSGNRKPVTLTDIDSPSVLVTSLWPDGLSGQLPGDGDPGAEWEEALAAVSDGAAVIDLGESPVWVTRSEEAVEAPVDDLDDGADVAEPTVDVEEDIGPVAEETGGGGGGGGGGCVAGRPAGWPGVLLLALYAALRRRRSALSSSRGG